MEKAGIEKKEGYAAHHMVPSGDKRYEEAQKARDILDRFGVDINDANNGVYLPQSKSLRGLTSETYHPRLHTKKYYQNVYNRLSSAETDKEVIEILQKIKDQLSKGNFPH